MPGFDPEAAFVQVAGRLAAIEQNLQEFQNIAWSLLALARRAPVHLDVEHLAVERLEFKVDSVDVGELSGELNIGLTSRLNLGPGAGAGEGPAPGGTEAPPPDQAGATDPAPPPMQSIWPPP